MSLGRKFWCCATYLRAPWHCKLHRSRHNLSYQWALELKYVAVWALQFHAPIVWHPKIKANISLWNDLAGETIKLCNLSTYGWNQRSQVRRSFSARRLKINYYYFQRYMNDTKSSRVGTGMILRFQEFVPEITSLYFPCKLLDIEETLTQFLFYLLFIAI